MPTSVSVLRSTLWTIGVSLAATGAGGGVAGSGSLFTLAAGTPDPPADAHPRHAESTTLDHDRSCIAVFMAAVCQTSASRATVVSDLGSRRSSVGIADVVILSSSRQDPAHPPCLHAQRWSSFVASTAWFA